jgi:ethanolamine utilization protein EutA (predicted chaperonin)
MHCIDKNAKKSWAETENAVEKFRCGGFTSLYTHINYIETTCYTIITRLIKMNDAELAQRYLKTRENTKAGNKRYLATEHGRNYSKKQLPFTYW